MARHFIGGFFLGFGIGFAILVQSHDHKSWKDVWSSFVACSFIGAFFGAVVWGLWP